MNRREKASMELLKSKNKILEENYRSLNEIYEANSRLYHDIHNHLNLLYQMLEQGRTEEALNYICSVSAPMRVLSRHIWTNIPIVDAIINSKSLEAKAQGITLDINAEFPEGTGIASDDLSVILTNLIDNAMEASVKETEKEKRFLNLTIRRIQHMILIRVENNSPVPPRRRRSLFSTTKPDSVRHGWGLKNVIQAADHYQGSAVFEYRDGIFTATVMLSF